jgi:hypothetical protein
LSRPYVKTIILPRQARDKHGESTQKHTVFLQILSTDPPPHAAAAAAQQQPPGDDAQEEAMQAESPHGGSSR